MDNVLATRFRAFCCLFLILLLIRLWSATVERSMLPRYKASLETLTGLRAGHFASAQLPFHARGVDIISLVSVASDLISSSESLHLHAKDIMGPLAVHAGQQHQTTAWSGIRLKISCSWYMISCTLPQETLVDDSAFPSSLVHRKLSGYYLAKVLRDFAQTHRQALPGRPCLSPLGTGIFTQICLQGTNLVADAHSQSRC